MRTGWMVTGAAVTAAVVGLSVVQAEQQSRGARGVDAARIIAADDEPQNWLTHGRDYGEQRFSPLDQINDETVSDLGLAWTYDVGSRRGQEATPLVADGVMYLTSAWSRVHALDARTGEELWSYDPEVPGAWARYACCDVVNRGLAMWGDHVFHASLDGRLIKLDAATGAVEWEVDTIDSETPYTSTGAPRIVKGLVVIGNGGAEYGVRGYITAYDADTGEEAWRFYTVPGDPSQPFEHPELEAAAATWSGEWWTIGGGGTVWDSMSYDPELDLLYVGTGNGSPWTREHRSPGGGDNLYISSILAIDPDDGSMVWYYQQTPGDNWDYTATQHIMVAELDFGGQQRKVVMQAPKNGFYYVLDAATGELLSAEPYARLNWASHVDMATGRPVETEQSNYNEVAKIIYPGPTGGHNWQPMAFSPDTGLVYIPSHDRGYVYGFNDNFDYTPGLWNLGTALTEEEAALNNAMEPELAQIKAWDPVAGRAVWSIRHPSASNGGLLATAGNLIFQGASDGVFAAYTADAGHRLWEMSLDIGMLAPPITYAVDGEQYVTVLAGWGGAGGGASELVREKQNPGRVFTFKLGGDMAVPEVPPRTQNAQPPPRFGTPAQLARGRDLYETMCRQCHGPNAVSRGVIADLRFSSAAVHNNWATVVLDGRYENRGMASFADTLSEDDVNDIHAYIVDLAHAALSQ